MSGPLTGIRVVEIEGIGPAPFAGMMLSDMGADVIRVSRPPAGPARPGVDVMGRGRRSIGVDLKDLGAAEVVLRLCEGADILIEGFRPGVAERLGIGPEPCLARNPALVYGRMTGWGQTGPHAPRAGHDITYLAVTGALAAIGPAGGPPVPPLNLVGDFGGGGMLLAFGVVCAALEARQSGRGQVVDSAMVDGIGALTAMFHGLVARGAWTPERGANHLDGGAPYYTVYETSDGRHVAVGAIEERFYLELLGHLGLDPAELPDRQHRANWPALRKVLGDTFATRTRDEWAADLGGADTCVAPVLTFAEAHHDRHLHARGSFTEVEGVVQPAPAPRFSRTGAAIGGSAPAAGADTTAVLRESGWPEGEIARLRSAGTVF